jgi:hypothetical protein
MINHPEAREQNVIENGLDIPWITPIDFLKKWDGEIDSLAKMICLDIAKRINPQIELAD